MELLTEIFKSFKKNDKVLIYIMYISIFVYISFLFNINESFTSIIRTVFGIDISELLKIVFRYLIFAYKIIFVLVFFFLIANIVFDTINEKLEIDWILDMNVYWLCFSKTCLRRTLNIAYYLLFLILSVGSLSISENFDIYELGNIIQRVLDKNQGIFWISSLGLFTAVLFTSGLFTLWDNYKYRIDNPRVDIFKNKKCDQNEKTID